MVLKNTFEMVDLPEKNKDNEGGRSKPNQPRALAFGKLFLYVSVRTLAVSDDSVLPPLPLSPPRHGEAVRIRGGKIPSLPKTDPLPLGGGGRTGPLPSLLLGGVSNSPSLPILPPLGGWGGRGGGLHQTQKFRKKERFLSPPKKLFFPKGKFVEKKYTSGILSPFPATNGKAIGHTRVTTRSVAPKRLTQGPFLAISGLRERERERERETEQPSKRHRRG